MTLETSLLIISALGGAVVALLLQSLFKLTGFFWALWRPLAVYDCANTREGPGDLQHGWGKRVDDAKASNGQAWEHTLYRPVPDREHTIFGPYTNDFGKPGFYRVKFRIYASGFAPTNEAAIVVDVVQAPFGTIQSLMLIGQRFIRGTELRPQYRTFSVYCYAAGSSVYEYRCRVEGAYDPNQHIVRFDNIKVYWHLPVWEAL